jgi:hypothetical protein
MSSAQQLPRCFFTLSTRQARREYKLIARMLADAGRLTFATHRALSSYAAQIDAISKAMKDRKQLRAHQFAVMDKARAQLKLEELERPAPPPRAPAPVPTANKYAQVGFASRLPVPELANANSATEVWPRPASASTTLADQFGGWQPRPETDHRRQRRG